MRTAVWNRLDNRQHHENRSTENQQKTSVSEFVATTTKHAPRVNDRWGCNNADNKYIAKWRQANEQTKDHKYDAQHTNND